MGSSSKQRAAPAPAASGRWRDVAAIAALGGLVLAAYANSLSSPFVRDARPIIAGNPRVQEVSWHNLLLIFTKGYWWPSSPLPLYRPFTTLSFLANWSGFGERDTPLGYHVVNLVLHAANAGLLYLVALQLGRPGPWLRRAALIAAALFAVHPVHTEALDSIVGRSDELVAFGLLVGLLAHRQASTARRGARTAWLVVLAVAAFVSAFSKESGLIFIAVLVLHDALIAWPPRRWASYLSTAPAIVTFLVMRHIALAENAWFPGWSFVDNPIVGIPRFAGVMTALKVFSLQLGLLAFPRTLSCDYSFDAIPVFGGGSGALDDLPALIGLLAVVVLVAVALSNRSRFRLVAFGALFFLGALLPTANLLFPTGSLMAERFLYVPSLGLFLMVASGVATLLERFSSALFGWALPGLAVVALGIRTHVRNADWHNDLSLWQATVAAVPNSFRAQGSLARATFEQGPTDENLIGAIQHARLAVSVLESHQLPPQDLDTTPFADLAHYLRLQGEALRSRQDETNGNRRLGEAWDVVERGERANDVILHEAIAQGGPAKKLGNAPLDLEIFAIAADLQRWPEARVAITRAEESAPLNPGVHLGIARLRLSEGELDDAAVALVKALILDGRNAGAWKELQNVYSALGADGAIVVRGGRPGFDPSVEMVRTHTNRAANELIAALVELGSLDSARVVYRRAIDPTDLGCPPEAITAPP